MPDETLRQPLPGGVTPEAMDVFQDAWKEFIDDLGPYLLAGVAQTLITVPIMILMFFVIYFSIITTLFGGIFVGAIGGAVVGDVAGEEAGLLVFMVSYVGSFFLMFAVILVLSMLVGAMMAPLNASMVRRVAEHQRGGRKLDFTAPFSDAMENIVGTITVVLLVGTVVTCGVLLCYVPGIIAAFMLIYASSLVYLHRTSPLVAVRHSAQHFMANLQFHGLFTLLYFGCAMISAYVPVIGPMFLLAVHVRAHRTLFGDGEDAVMDL